MKPKLDPADERRLSDMPTYAKQAIAFAASARMRGGVLVVPDRNTWSASSVQVGSVWLGRCG